MTPPSFSTAVMPGLSIVECEASAAAAWDDFVMRNGGTYCHRFAWKEILAQSYGLKTHFLSLRDGHRWRAVLALAVMPRLPGQSRRAVCLPYCNYGGLVAEAGADVVALRTAALAYLEGRGVHRIEFRDLAPAAVPGSELTMVLRLPGTEELLWKQIGDKVRNQVRKAQRAGLTLQWGAGQADALYDIYAANMGRLGTPVHSPRYFRAILAGFGGDAEVLTVRHQGEAIGAMLVVKHAGTWADPAASCRAEFSHLNPNMLLYWEALRAATGAGATGFDFGRSARDSGTHRFKRQWGAAEVPLDYHEYRHGQRQEQAATSFYRGSGASRLAAAWRVLPCWLQRWLGPTLRRRLP